MIRRGLVLAVAVALAACASAGEPGWRNSGAIPFEIAKARCQIETQVVDGPAWETCMEALGWTRERPAREGGYDIVRTALVIVPDAAAHTADAR